MGRYCEGTPMRHRKTACFEALVLEPHFDQILGEAHACASAFSCLFRTKNGPVLCDIYIYIGLLQFPSPWPASKPASKCFVPNFHSLATLEARFKACLETCLILANVLFCCNFHSLEDSRPASRPSPCASCGLKL